jgi:hypothetical protein
VSKDIRKDLATEDFIDDFRAFSEESMTWCAGQSQKATESISQILNVLLEDAKRISKMSETTLQAIQTMRQRISTADSKETNAIIASLKALCQDHVEVGEFIYPIVETLQFQDRISQNMQNISRMLAAWAAERSRLKDAHGASWSEEAQMRFGHALLECTTMKEERDAVRAVIRGLPEEKEQDAMQLF